MQTDSYNETHNRATFADDRLQVGACGLQGRTTWWNPVSKSTDDADDDDDEDREDRHHVEPEVGPPLLTPLSEDAEVNGMLPWTTRISSKLISQYAVAVVHSCLWPGAHAFCTGRYVTP